MPRRRRMQLSEQRFFFVTTSTLNKKRIFNSQEKLQKLLDIIVFNIQRNNAMLFGYVLMINQFHLLVHVEGGEVLSKIMHDIKSYSARTLFPDEGSIWMSRFDDVAIYTDKQFQIKLSYIHNNPVKAKIVRYQEDYQFSSAKNWLYGIDDGIVTINMDKLSGRDA